MQMLILDFFSLICCNLATFNKHFGKYGEITDSVIMKDRYTGQPRDFGFITYADPSVVDKVIEDTHVINGKQVIIFMCLMHTILSLFGFNSQNVLLKFICSSPI